MSREGAVLFAAVAVHVGLTALHGLVHAAIPVHVDGWQYGFAAATVAVSLAGGGFALRGRLATGALLAGLGGAAALGFEGLFHFVVPGPDHVASVERGHDGFAATAVLTTAGDAVLLAVAAWVLASRGEQ